ncbi:alpha/beta fold hydrolase [Pseudolysinimonas sp.]|uniref:alpha/beta fold hydrolase n=1 Tax=Pseudolysinimonas sp. TaxID=2680009 RepID=UPI003F7D3B5C
MNVMLISGFWWDGSLWREVEPALRAAGHEVRTPTLPGLRDGDDPSAVGMRESIDAVVEEVDAVDAPVALVGHSGGGPIAWAAADARPEAVARVVFVDSFPLPEGANITDEWEPADGTLPLPAWEEFPPSDLRDLDDALRAEFRRRARPEPLGVARDPMHYSGDAAVRRAIPATLIATGFPADDIRGTIAAGHPLVAELAELTAVDIVDLPTGHWPQLTKPTELTELLLAILGR